MIDMHFVWAGSESDTLPWHGQELETSMFQVWVVEVGQPVVYLTLAGRNNCDQLYPCGQLGCCGEGWMGCCTPRVLVCQCLLPCPTWGCLGPILLPAGLGRCRFLSFDGDVLILHQ